MIYIIARISVKNFSVLDEFERQALSHLKKVGGELITAFETLVKEDGTGEEVHILRFPNLESFEGYKSMTNTPELNLLRERAIQSIELTFSTKIKLYL